MSDDRYNFEFHGLSDDEELERLLESVRRDIGEASPEPARSAQPQPRRSEPEPEPVQEPAPRPQRPEPRQSAPHAQQLRQARPNAHSPRPGSAQAGERREQPRRQAVAEKDLPPQRERIRVVHPEDERPERKSSRFGLAFGIYTAVLALVLIAGCVLLWFYLGSYEATRPEQVMQDFSEMADEAYWSDAISGAFTVGETPFETRDELMEELCLSVLRDNPMEWREDEGYSADNMVYMVSAGGVDFCRVTLDEVAENGDAGFGFTYLEVTRVELLASFTAPEAHSITITAPADAVVSVNGVELTAEYVDAEMAVDNAALPDLEANIADKLYTVYTVTGLYAPVEVAAVDAGGNVLAAEGEVTDDAVTFALGEGTLDYRILVPEDSTVTVNGVELDGSYNTGDAVVPAFLEGYGDYGTLPELELWLVEGLHTAPEITVADSEGEELGEPVVNGNELAFFAAGDQTLEDAHSTEASSFMNAYIDYLTGEGSSDEDYTALQALVLDGSSLDTALSELHDRYEASGLTAERVRVRDGSFVSIGATCFTCTVDVEYAPAEEDGENTNVAYTVVFVMNGGIWLVSSVVS